MQTTLITPAEFQQLNAAGIGYLLRTGQLDHLQQVPLKRPQIEDIWNHNPDLIEALVQKNIIFAEEVKL